MPLHLIFEFLAMTIGYRYYLYLKKQEGDVVNDKSRAIVLVAAAIGALLGSRIVGLLEHPDLWHDADILTIFSNKTILGGLLWGLWSVEITKKIVGINTSTGDLFTYPLMLAIMIGRVGCFLAGLKDSTYGNPTELFTGVDFGDQVYRHPTQLYEMFFLLVLFFSLKYLEKKYVFYNGLRFQIFLFSYCVFRFLVEYIKPNDFYIYGFSAIQVNSLLGICYYLFLWIFKYVKKLWQKENMHSTTSR